ncbi:protein Turandot M-like [Drosophila kikkawai]|uniref:Protein Turandot M-like n=1 Tax=Drosophila kikkawai TaxID=30033 RepID=A0A6P4I5H4_DROKI|nr:protein Turandot M-like [Drosophila kikkawai]
MNPTLFLSFLVVIIGSLVWTATAQEDLESQKQRIIEIFKNADAGSIGESDVVFLVHFLEKHRNVIPLTPEQQSLADAIVRKYNEEKAKQPLVEGAPPQGGWITDALKKLAVEVGLALAEAIKKTLRP